MSVTSESVVSGMIQEKLDTFRGIKEYIAGKLNPDHHLVACINTHFQVGVIETINEGANINVTFDYLFPSSTPSVRDYRSGMTPIILACIRENYEAALAIMATNRVSPTTSFEGTSMLHYAARLGHLDLLKAILPLVPVNKTAPEGVTPLIEALTHMSSYSLIHKGRFKDADTQETLKKWYLNKSVKKSQLPPDPISLTWNVNADVVQYLLSQGANPNMITNFSGTKISPVQLVNDPTLFSRVLQDRIGAVSNEGISNPLSYNVVLVNRAGIKTTARVTLDLSLVKPLILKYAVKSSPTDRPTPTAPPVESKKMAETSSLLALSPGFPTSARLVTPTAPPLSSSTSTSTSSSSSSMSSRTFMALTQDREYSKTTSERKEIDEVKKKKEDAKVSYPPPPTNPMYTTVTDGVKYGLPALSKPTSTKEKEGYVDTYISSVKKFRDEIFNCLKLNISERNSIIEYNETGLIALRKLLLEVKIVSAPKEELVKFQTTVVPVVAAGIDRIRNLKPKFKNQIDIFESNMWSISMGFLNIQRKETAKP